MALSAKYNIIINLLRQASENFNKGSPTERTQLKLVSPIINIKNSIKIQYSTFSKDAHGPMIPCILMSFEQCISSIPLQQQEPESGEKHKNHIKKYTSLRRHVHSQGVMSKSKCNCWNQKGVR